MCSGGRQAGATVLSCLTWRCGLVFSQGRDLEASEAAHYFCNPSNLDGRVYVYVCIWLGLGLVLRLGLGLRLRFAMICSGHGHLCLTGCRNSAPSEAAAAIRHNQSRILIICDQTFKYLMKPMRGARHVEWRSFN